MLCYLLLCNLWFCQKIVLPSGSCSQMFADSWGAADTPSSCFEEGEKKKIGRTTTKVSCLTGRLCQSGLNHWDIWQRFARLKQCCISSSYLRLNLQLSPVIPPPLLSPANKVEVWLLPLPPILRVTRHLPPPPPTPEHSSVGRPEFPRAALGLRWISTNPD